MKQYDYIFLGAGCASLSLLVHLQEAGLLRDKTVLVIDQAEKTSNDRTWCFWEKEKGLFESTVYRQWEQLWFHAPGFSKRLSIDPYRYKMIRSAAFYQYCRDRLAGNEVQFLQASVSAASFDGQILHCTLDGVETSFRSGTVFNSFPPLAHPRESKSIDWLQHFKGWMVHTASPVFHPGEAVLMDFRVSQSAGTCFVYVLPVDAQRALVEYTLFSGQLLPPAAYDEGLRQYLQSCWPGVHFEVEETEFGVIPMTTRRFPWYADGMYQIGTAGGQTKASSGYTFQFIQKQNAAIVKALEGEGLRPGKPIGAAPPRFRFYDKVLLTVLDRGYCDGSTVFTRLFQRNDPQRIFSFLDNVSSIPEDLALISSLPVWPFLKAAIR